MLSVGGLFDGVGLLAYGLHRAGLRHEWLCEVDPWRRTILAQRFPGAVIHDDVRTVGARTATRVDVIAGGFPCKGASTAGPRTGFDHPETVLWREMRRAIGELRPRYVLVENVANLLAIHDGAVWGEVLGDLAALGFDVEWDCIPAAAVGAPHRRDRVFAVATYTASVGEREPHHEAHAIAGGREARPLSGERGAQAAPDAERERGAGRGTPGHLPGPRGEAQGEARQRQRGRDAADHRGATPADASRSGRGADVEDLRPRQSNARGSAIDWGEYEPAIRRWEQIAGAAPEPVVRRVDDRSAARVERSRLSALGDGVQVQVAELAGAHILELERQRCLAHAA